MKKKAHSIDMIFILVLFSIFAVMSVLLIIIGSNVYTGITESRDIDGNNRNVLSYVTNKIRASQVEDGIFIEEKDGVQVLVIETLDGDMAYETLIYKDGDSLKEATIMKGDDYNLDFGDVLAEVEDFTVEINDISGIITMTVTSGDESLRAEVYSGIDR